MFANRKIKLTISFVAVVALLLFAGTTWVANRTVAWVRDLPNRIHIDGEALGNAVTGSIRSNLHATDTETQLQILKSLSDGATQDAEFLGWIRDEYSDDFRTLSESANADVANNAAALLSLKMDSD
jgi:hypothetical protein